MNDKILDRLENESASCNDPIRKALIDAELAYHFARAGDFLRSDHLLTAIRSLPRSQFVPSVAIWVMLSEGIVEFFRDLDPHAHDRFRRAFALSVSIGDLDLQALASAWLAHAELHQRNYPAMVLSANHCLAIYPKGQTTAHSRIFMVLANANLYAGNVSIANAHYERSRSIALADGDRATVGAIVYNRAALLLNNFRVRKLVNVGEHIDIGLVSTAVESAATFQKITQNKSLAELPLLSEARLAMIRGDYLQAMRMIDAIRSSAHRRRAGTKDSMLDIEYASCMANCGDPFGARSVVEGVDLSRYLELDNDDRVIFFSLLIEIRDQIGCGLSIDEPTELIKVAIADYSNEMSLLRSSIASIRFGGGYDAGHNSMLL